MSSITIHGLNKNLNLWSKLRVYPLVDFAKTQSNSRQAVEQSLLLLNQLLVV